MVEIIMGLECEFECEFDGMDDFLTARPTGKG
jgi:hypothetical protein